jgi:hypothetical protein
MAALSVIRMELTVEQLRAAAARQTNAKVARRILAMAMVLAGYSREAAGLAQAMDRQTLRDWVIRHNQFAIEGRWINLDRVVRRCSTRRSRLNLRHGSSKVPTWRRQANRWNGHAVCRRTVSR